MVNPNHPKGKRSRKRRRKERQSGDIIPPTEFWTNDGEHDKSNSSYADVSLSPVLRDRPISDVLSEANRVLEGNTEDPFPATSTPSMSNPPPLDDRLVEAIATRVEQKMMGQFETLSQQLQTTLGGRIKQLEEKVVSIESENKQLKADLRALTVAGLDPTNATSIVDMVKEKVEEVMLEKQVLCKKSFAYDCTVVAIGVTELPGEDPRNIAETLLRDGLRLPHLVGSIVRACRLPFNTKTGKSGHVKIEMESEDVKKQIIAVTGRLKGYTALGYKVIVRSSQPHDTRVMVGNMHTLVKAMKLNNELLVTPHGAIRPLTQAQNQQQYQMGQQTAYQWNQPQMTQPAPPLIAQQQMPRSTQHHVEQTLQPQVNPLQTGQTTVPQMTNQFQYTVPPTAFQPQVGQQAAQPQQFQQTQAQARPQSAPNYSAQSYANVAQNAPPIRNNGPSTLSSQLPFSTTTPTSFSLSQRLQNLAHNTMA